MTNRFFVILELFASQERAQKQQQQQIRRRSLLHWKMCVRMCVWERRACMCVWHKPVLFVRGGRSARQVEFETRAPGEERKRGEKAGRKGDRETGSASPAKGLNGESWGKRLPKCKETERNEGLELLFCKVGPKKV